MSLIYPKRIKQVLRGENPTISIGGFNKIDSTRTITETIRGKDGKYYDVFEEGGKRYVMQGRSKVNVKFILPEENLNPLFCPSCNHIMKSHLDKKMYSIHNLCFDCSIKIESRLKREGLWERYEKQRIILNKISFINEMKTELEGIMKNGIDDVIHYVNSDGSTEKWINNDKSKVEEFIQSELSVLNKELEDANEELNKTGEIINVKYNKY